MLKSLILTMVLPFMLCSLTACKKDKPEPEPEPIIGDGYYVAVDGSDLNPGTFDSPWATWQKAFEMAEPGDTVYFRGGVYKPAEAWYDGQYYNCLYMPNKSIPIGNDGKPGSPIHYFNYPGETPILDCSLIVPFSNFNTAINLTQVNYVHFKGLTIRNVLQTRDFVECFGIGAADCSNLTFENITIHNVDGNAIRVGGAFGYFPEITSDTTRFINCDVYDCNDALPREEGATLGGAADGFKTWNEPGSCFIFDGCRSWNNSDDGFDPGTDALTIINNCWSFQNGHLDGDGVGFKTGGMLHDNGDKITRIVTNCIAAFNSATGFFLLEYPDYYRTNAHIYNNISYANGSNGFSFSRNEFQPTVLASWINNVSFENEGLDFDNAYQPYNESHNTWDRVDGYPGFVATDSVTVIGAFKSLNVSELSGARQPEGSLPIVTFGHPKDESNLNGAGIYVGMSKNPDIGIDWEFLDRK